MRMLLAVALAVSLWVPAAPASAHARLPVGKYRCHDENLNYIYQDLYVRSNRRYTFKAGEEFVSRGRFAHPEDTAKIRFTSGHLYKRRYRARHFVHDDAYEVEMRRYSVGAWRYTFCYMSR